MNMHSNYFKKPKYFTQSTAAQDFMFCLKICSDWAAHRLLLSYFLANKSYGAISCYACTEQNNVAAC